MLLALEAMPIDLAPRPTLASSCGYVKLLPGARHLHYAAAAAQLWRQRFGDGFDWQSGVLPQDGTGPIQLRTYPEAIQYCGQSAPSNRIQAQGRLKVSHKADCAALQGCCFRLDCSSLLSKLASPSDLIGFLQSLPEGRKRRSVRYLQWLLLLLAILGILSGCRSARDLERFARRHRVDAGPNRRAGQGT